MIDFSRIESYVENNRIEAKRAQGGLPKSIWETYSAFANTLGGVILLGVEERADKSLCPVKLDDPDSLVDEFWRLVNDENVASCNILTRDNVKIIGIQCEKIVATEVPKADRKDKPVYVGGNIYTGTYRRSGEGDYRCTRESVDAMRQDSFLYDKDMKMIAWSGIDDVDESSLCNFLKECRALQCREDIFAERHTVEFLSGIGVVVSDEDDKIHLTAAGLLMFGKKKSIIKEYPYFSLVYKEFDSNVELQNIVGENIYQFYKIAYKNLSNLDVVNRYGDNIRYAIEEAFANSLLHADYYVSGGVIIEVHADKIIFSNPGTLRINADNAFLQGVFDPRNGTIIRIFKKIKPNSGNGQGLLGIKNVFRDNNLMTPIFFEEFLPERTTLIFDFDEHTGEEYSDGSQESLFLQKIKELYYRDLIIDVITQKSKCDFKELCEIIGGDESTAQKLLNELETKNLVTKNGVYKLKV